MSSDLSPVMRLEVAQALQLVGGLTSSIFPKAEAWLNESTDHMNAVRFIASRKDMNRYLSVMDFVFCEIFPTYKPACFKYYNDKGPMLKDMITVEELQHFGDVLLKGLELAHQMWSEQRRTSWPSFRRQVLALAA